MRVKTSITAVLCLFMIPAVAGANIEADGESSCMLDDVTIPVDWLAILPDIDSASRLCISTANGPILWTIYDAVTPQGNGYEFHIPVLIEVEIKPGVFETRAAGGPQDFEQPIRYTVLWYVYGHYY